MTCIGLFPIDNMKRNGDESEVGNFIEKQIMNQTMFIADFLLQ